MLNMMKSGLTPILGLLAMLCALSSAMAQDKPGKGIIVATVNGEVITAERLDQEMNAVKQRVAQSGQTLDQKQLDAMKKQILDSMIDFELLYQDAVKKGYKADTETVNKRFDEVKANFPSQEAFDAALAESGMTPESMKVTLQRELTVHKSVEKEFIEKAVVTEAAATAYYDKNRESFAKPEQRRARHILIKVDPKASEAEKAAARKRIEAIQERVKKGEDFAELAKELSEGPSKPKGGDLGYFARGQMVPPFEDAAFLLQPGEVSDVVTTQFGYHLIKCEDIQAPQIVPYDKIKARLMEYLKQQQARADMQTYVAKLREEAKVETFL